MLQRTSKNQNGHTFALGSVNWEQPGHRTAGSFLQKVNRSYHSILPLQCWDCRWKIYHPKRHLQTCVHCNNIYHVPRCMHTQSPFSEMDEHVRGAGTHTHTHTQTHRHPYTHIHWHMTPQSKSMQNVFSSNMNRDADDRWSNSEKKQLSQ